MIEASDTTWSKLGGNGSIKNGATVSLFLAGLLSKTEDSRTVNTNQFTNGEKVQVSDVIDNYGESAESSNGVMEYSDFVMDDEDIT